MSGGGLEALPDVWVWSGAHPYAGEWSGGPPGHLGVVGRPFQMSLSGGRPFRM